MLFHYPAFLLSLALKFGDEYVVMVTMIFLKRYFELTRLVDKDNETESAFHSRYKYQNFQNLF